VAVPVLIRVVVSRAVMSTPVPIVIAAFPLIPLTVMVSVLVPVASSVAFRRSLATVMVSVSALAPFLFLLSNAFFLGLLSG
jgi:hypothetical protein